MKKIKTENVEIPVLLKKEIEYYIKKNKEFSDFNEFLTYYLNIGLQNEILGTTSQLEHSYRCHDFNQKIVRRVYYDDLSGKSEYFLCEKHRNDPVFDRYAFEDNATSSWVEIKYKPSLLGTKGLWC